MALFVLLADAELAFSENALKHLRCRVRPARGEAAQAATPALHSENYNAAHDMRLPSGRVPRCSHLRLRRRSAPPRH